MAESGAFQGFSHEAMQFLVDLSANNERSWFQPRKADYERLLKQPLEALITDLGAELARLKVPLRADPSTSPFRIYRDVRFSKDKSPYKTHVAASFPWVGDGEAWVVGTSERHGGGYFHFSPEGSYMGGGMWHPEPPRLAAFRKMVHEQPEQVDAAFNDPAFLKRFEPVHGDSLTRIPKGYPSDHPRADLLKLKDVTFGREVGDEVFSPTLPRILAADFAKAVPVMRFLASLEPVD
ncbi:MAG: DUF2461 domain-containing protein [Candidatus Limnocylindrales bacterium]